MRCNNDKCDDKSKIAKNAIFQTSGGVGGGLRFSEIKNFFWSFQDIANTNFWALCLANPEQSLNPYSAGLVETRNYVDDIELVDLDLDHDVNVFSETDLQ